MRPILVYPRGSTSVLKCFFTNAVIGPYETYYKHILGKPRLG